ncbi:MAG: hypothetical protein WCF84_24355, partial [Anaerolineae bacterium]
NVGLATPVAVYILVGLWAERSRRLTHQFLVPLYFAAHLVAAFVLLNIYAHPLLQLLRHSPWTDEMRIWDGLGQILFGVAYAIYAWGTFRERWAHAATWLLAAGVGFIALVWSSGSGSLAARAAMGAIAYVGIERGLYWLKFKPSALRRYLTITAHQRAFVRLGWRLYRRPLLVTGWTLSVGAIGIALVRNLILLGGGQTQQLWAVIALTLVVGLYALSARLFRQARFAWFAAWLVFIPWTIMTNLGWLVATAPSLPGFAVSWVVLAWALYLLSILIARFAPNAYARPALIVAQLLVPFALLWGLADRDTSRISFFLAIGFYAFAALRDHLRLVHGATPSSVPFWNVRFLYPALGLVPVWCLFLLGSVLPAARYEHDGLMLLPFGILGILAGRVLARLAPNGLPHGAPSPGVGPDDRRDGDQAVEGQAERPRSEMEASERQSRASSPVRDRGVSALAGAYALPAYLTGYVSVIFGTLLVAHILSLLVLVLLYDALLMLVSARLFRNPLWVFGAAGSAALSFWLAIHQAGISTGRQGWWLLGLAAVYLLLAWGLRRARLTAYSTAPLTIAFVLTALSLPPSSLDQTGAFWGYGGAALLYAITAFWLQQPALLIPACALILIPYAVGLRQSNLMPMYYGLSLYPGAVLALAAGWWLDRRYGAWRDFPWGDPGRWLVHFVERVLNWWALPLYLLGFGLAIASPLLTDVQWGPAALNAFLLIPLFGWAIYRFRLRFWLFALMVAGHIAQVLLLQYLGWWRIPAEASIRYLPVTVITVFVALGLARWRNEKPPFAAAPTGWSHPLYLLVLYDLIMVQGMGLSATVSGASVSLVHALLIGLIASAWGLGALIYLSASLGVVALFQWLASDTLPLRAFPVPFAQLTLAYGLYGHLLFAWRQRRPLAPWLALWAGPLMRFSHWFSLVVLAVTGALSIDLIYWSVRALIGLDYRTQVSVATVQMAVGVLALIGLLYVLAAYTYRRARLSYIAIGMLLVAWMLHAFYVQQWDGAARIQWYALPAGFYLLGMGYLEWRRGNRTLGRWLDYAAVTLLMGSLFWQTLLFGFAYALLLGAEGFAAFWWGSARRLRRFLYAGLMGVVLATVAQLVNSLQSINQWIVFGLIGLLVVFAAIAIERKMEDIKAWRQVLETWE